MKNTFCFSFIINCICSTFLFSQSTLPLEWIKQESSINGQVEGWGLDVDPDGNIFWAISNNKSRLDLDIACYKFDQAGNALWASPSIFGDLGTQQAYTCRYLDNQLYIGGRNCSGLVNTCDMLLLSLDPVTGIIQWDHTLNFMSNGYDEIDGLEVYDGTIYCGGWGQAIQEGAFQSDIGLWALDKQGNTLWINHFGQANTAEHQDGHFVVSEDKIFVTGLWGGTGLGNLYNGAAFLGSFSIEDGALLDSVLFGHPSTNLFDIENALGMTSDGDHLYVTGYTTPLAADDWQIFIAKFNLDLEMEWFVDWGGSGTESARAITVTDQHIYVGGLSESEEIISEEGRNAVLLKLDKNGNIQNYYHWGDTLNESFLDIAFHNNNIYLTGTAESNGSNIIRSAFLLKSSDLTSVSLNESIEDILLYPNPGYSEINIQIPQEVKKITIITLDGRVIRKYPNPPKDFQLTDLLPGQYLLMVDYGVSRLAKKFTIH